MEENIIKLGESGRWEVKVILRKAGYKPVAKCVYGDTYEECAQLVSRIKVENGFIDSSLFSPQMLFKDWVEIWCLYTARGRHSITSTNYERLLRLYILPTLGSYPINKITAGVLECFYANLLKNGRKRLRDLYGPGLSVNMVLTIHKAVVAIFNAAVERSFLEVNPAVRAKVPRLHRASKKIYTYTELKILLSEARKHGVYELILFALCTGLERGELCALTWKDIRFNSGKVLVNQSLRYVHREYCLEPLRKLCQRRQIVLSPKLLSILKEYKKTSNSNWVFPSAFKRGAKPRSPVSLTTLFKTLLKSSGVIDGSFHSLRDTCAVIYLDSGMDLRSLTSLLGFENVRTVKRAFVPYMSSKKVVAANRMESAMASIKSLYNG